jgi:hypothetical protein
VGERIVLRSLWPKFSTEAISVHALPYGGDAALVSIDELDDVAARGGLQRNGRIAVVTAAEDRRPFAILPRVDLV